MVIDSSDDEDLDCAKETAPEIHDIDSGNDIFSVSEYASEIYQNLKQAEVHVFLYLLFFCCVWGWSFVLPFELVWMCARWYLQK